jgi:hypothetical protein
MYRTIMGASMYASPPDHMGRKARGTEKIMRIGGTRIRHLAKYLQRVPGGAEYRVINRMAVDAIDKVLERTGFGSGVASGSVILPKVVGPVSRFNAHGKHVPLKHLPKQSRYIRTIEWSWDQWDGRYGTKTVTEERDIYRDCYQVESLAPPAVELTFMQGGDEALIVSPRQKADGADIAAGLHVVNLYLELYGACEIVRDDLGSFDPPAVRHVNWRMLPSGRHPWDKVAGHLADVLWVKDPRVRTVILSRHETINRYMPDEVYVGEGGFDRYVAYVFISRGLVVLECTELDNAIYVFGRKWAEFSKLSKADILAANLHLERIVHCDGWRTKFDRLMRITLAK